MIASHSIFGLIAMALAKHGSLVQLVCKEWMIMQPSFSTVNKCPGLQVAEPEGFSEKQKKGKRKGEAPKFAAEPGGSQATTPPPGELQPFVP